MAAIMTPSSGLANTGCLKILRDSVNDSDGVDIVLVPGIGTISPEEWPFADPEWLSTLPGSCGEARIFAYEYPSPFLGTKPSWESMLMLGYDLLQQLGDARSQSDLDETITKPILLVCHSLGGVAVKQALCVAHNQFLRYGSTVNAVAGVIFLGTPHRYGDKATSFVRFRDLFETTTSKSLKIPNASMEHEGAILLDLASRFEMVTNNTPILSAYELRESKTSLSHRVRSTNKLLVDRDTCSTHIREETIIGLNLNHHDICQFTKSVGGEGLPELHKFLYETLHDAGRLFVSRLESTEYQYATTSAYSPTMSELPQRVEQLELTEWPSNHATEWPSNGATEGTSLSGFEMIHSTTPNTETWKSLHLPCFLFNTHTANKDFCGREDILGRLAAELLPPKNMVTASRSSVKQFALCGFGGIGKTEIAREFARRHKDSFDAVFWVVADEVAKLDYHYQQISLALGLEDPSEYDPVILADYWPQGSGSILVTSRDPLAKCMFTRRPTGLDLGPLSQRDSLSLFNHLTTNTSEADEDIAQRISDALAGVPLAISQMAGIIRRQELTLSEFFELYTDQEEHASLYETKFDTNLVTYRHSLATVWAFGKLKPQAQRLLELIAFLDPDVIGDDLLMEAAVKLLSDGTPFKKLHYIEARTDLLQSSLVQRDKQKQQLSVHRIVQDVILATMDVERKRFLFDQVVRILWADWPSAMPKPSRKPELPEPKSTGGRLYVGRWPACAAIYPHVLKIHQLWPAISEPSEATRLLFAKLLNEAAWYQKERGRTKQFDGFFETARSICETSTHPDRDALLADIYFCLGAIAMDASEFDTSRIYKERSLNLVSKICKELETADDRLYLAYAERGISRIQDRRYEEGEADLKEALRIRKALGNYVPRAGEATLSWSLLAQGKLEECDTLLSDSLAGREKALGKNDTEYFRTGLILYALGNLRAAQGLWDESFEYHDRAWRHMRATVGDRDFYTANVIHKMAQHLFRSGQHERAITMVNAALDIWSVDPSAHKNEIARTTFLKGKLLEAMGKTQKASVAFRVACRLRREITKEDRDMKTLTTEDFDGIIAFWSR
ncbi:uncharacterized protein N7515_005390 [Penicillium bovifimosum]|uniref:DUF7779 domain-containing protein n=1 Tax=Penicillium bovifimosum TaxID=126998 RepID=A0A9W9KZS5_9EURO|nr:uncharacterized protein N7515_005390 [Penicillium bovifimosum]KAJ5129351.1 hypothetical protein N7515_005390 [Penicillium bovifimosum]